MWINLLRKAFRGRPTKKTQSASRSTVRLEMQQLERREVPSATTAISPLNFPPGNFTGHYSLLQEPDTFHDQIGSLTISNVSNSAGDQF
jgi:hypothetical protein